MASGDRASEETTFMQCSASKDLMLNVNAMQWNLSKTATVLGSHLSKTASLPAPKCSTDILQSTSVKVRLNWPTGGCRRQVPLY